MIHKMIFDCRFGTAIIALNGLSGICQLRRHFLCHQQTIKHLKVQGQVSNRLEANRATVVVLCMLSKASTVHEVPTRELFHRL